MWRVLLVTLGWCAGAGLAAAQTAGAPPLSLRQAVELALAHNRAVASARLGVRRSLADEQVARSQRLPRFSVDALGSRLLTSLSFTIPAGQLGAYAATGPIPATNVELTTPPQITGLIAANVAQPLTQLHRINLEVRKQELGTGLAREQLRQQQQEIADQVRQTYYGLLQTRAALQAAGALLRFDRELNQLTGRYLAQRVVLKSDSLQVGADLAGTRLEIATLADQQANARESLNELMGRPLQTAFTVEPMPARRAEEVSLDEARRRAMENRPEIREARLTEQQAQVEEGIQKSYYWPDVGVRLDYIGLLNYEPFLPTQFLGVGFQLQWEPFDWGRKRAQVAASALALRQSETGLEETEQKVLLQVDELFRSLREARQRLQVAALQRAAQQEKLRVVMNEYGQKAVLLKDVLQQRAALVNAESQYEQDLLAYWKTRADLRRAMGEE